MSHAPLHKKVRQIVDATPILDIHTHLYPPQFGPLFLAGIDELVTYHYLIAELFRSSPVRPEEFWTLSKPQQADLIWKTLFVENTPVSEACRGVVNVLTAFKLDPHAETLADARAFFAAMQPHKHIQSVLKLANCSEVVMTNDVFDDTEAGYWERGVEMHPQFHAVLRLDPLLNAGDSVMARLEAKGYKGPDAARRFLADWIARMRPLYMAVSLPPDFAYPEDSHRARMLKEAIFPICREHNIPFSMMIGVRKRVNPILRDAGDSLGHADIATLERICAENPDNRFLVSYLSRENQHELCVAARKFSNLMPFGCWWFLNNPSIITEITMERLELLGASMIPQHSDARILDQVIYKWDHSRRLIAHCLTETYEALERDGWKVTKQQIQRDVDKMFQGNFRRWVGLPEYKSAKATA